MTGQIFPVSFGQQRLWFLDQLEPGTPAYNLLRVIRIRGPLDTAAFSRALQTIVDRHASLRTIFVSESGEPSQLVQPHVAVLIPETDLSRVPPPKHDEEIARMAGEEAKRSFDLNTGPLFRVRLLRLQPEVHILILVMHHIITDGWSMSIFFREIAAVYQHLVDREPLELPELTIQYPDFAQWQRKSMAGEILELELEYWSGKLGGSPRLLELPTDKPRPAIQTHRGASEGFFIDQNLTDALKTLSQREGASLYMILLAAFQILLWRYTSAEDILVGTPIAGRNELELENVIGLFVNTIIMRGDLSGNPSFLGFFRRVITTCFEAFEHQHAPFEKIVEELEPERSLSYAPLVQVMFILQNAPKQIIKLSHLELEELVFESGLAKFDLTLDITEAEGLHCTFEYSTDLFQAATIDRMTRDFESLLRSIVRDPKSRIADLEILNPHDKHRVLVEWNATRSPFREEATIHALFEEQVTRTPEATALVDDTERITYRELNERADHLARYLLSKQLAPEVPVAVLVERSIDMVAALLGVLKAGHPYLPLDPSYPEQRLAFMIQDSGTPVVITHRGLNALLPGDVDVLPLDRTWKIVDQHRSSHPTLGGRKHEVAYVIYTSGSTGRPKGVEGTHRATLNRFEWMWRNYPFAQGEVACQKTSIGFVDSIWEIFGPLLQGTCVVIIPDALVEPERLVGALSKHRITRVVLVPSLLRLLLEQVSDLGTKLPHVTLWISSGETLPLDLARRFRETLPNAKLLNLYGSSEVAADVTCEEVKDGEQLSSVPIGKPIANVQAYVLERHLRPVPIGARGEIYVGGECLARGYHRRPELTAERFIANPFDRDGSGRLYKTGDLGRFLADGRLEYLGRIDNQVKVRGVRIELGEIESILNEHPLVKEAAVTVQERNSESALLVGYVVPSETSLPGTTELRQYLKSRVPEYMIPSAFVVLKALPLLPNGKVNRTALPPIQPDQIAAQHAFVAPRSENEQKLASMWRDLLGIERIGVDRNFFELGGHSLLGMQLLARIRRTFDVDLPVRRLFEEPTISGLTVEIEKAKASGIPIQPRTVPRRSSISAQESLAVEVDKLSPDQLSELIEKLMREKQKRSTEST